MPKKGSGKKKAGKKLTEEEKQMLLEQEAAKAAQEKKQRAEYATKFLRDKLEQEEKNSRINLRKLNAQWRDILRKAKSEEIKKELTILSQTFERIIDHKDSILQALLHDLVEVEAQDSRAAKHHMHNLDKLVQFQENRMAEVHDEFEANLLEIKDEFMTERQHLLQLHEQQINDLKDILFAMKLLYEDRENESMAEFNSKRDEIRSKNLDERATLKAMLEAKVAELWEQFQVAQRNYEHSTEDKMSEFERLRNKDETTAQCIDQQSRKLQRIQDKIAACKHKLHMANKDVEARNRNLKQERDKVTKHLNSLKTQMTKARAREKTSLTTLTVESRKAQEELEKKLEKASKILKLGEIARKFETEEEKVLPFYADSVTKDEVEAEFGEEAKEEKELPTNSLRPVAVTVDEQPVGEVHALDNFWKRYNKVLLDKLAMDKERDRLAEENEKLKGLLKQYLDGISVSDEILSQNNSLLVVNAGSIPVGDPRVRGANNVTVVEAAHMVRTNRLR